jgi:hypothetical protein
VPHSAVTSSIDAHPSFLTRSEIAGIWFRDAKAILAPLRRSNSLHRAFSLTISCVAQNAIRIQQGVPATFLYEDKSANVQFRRNRLPRWK